MSRYRCRVCGYIHDEAVEGVAFSDLPADWKCPRCSSPKEKFELMAEETPVKSAPLSEKKDRNRGAHRSTIDGAEPFMHDIMEMAETGRPVIEPMRTLSAPIVDWDEIVIKGAQLAHLPLNHDHPVSTRTVIGPGAAHPIVIDTPIIITHMSFGALSKAAKTALAKGSAAARTAICSGEGGVLPEERDNAYKYIFEYAPTLYGVTEENLSRADAIEIKIGQAAKPGLGGELPAEKVTEEIARIRGVEPGKTLVGKARFDDISNGAGLKRKIDELREASGGKPIGIKLAAGDIEADLRVALAAAPDFITLDTRPGATGAAPKQVKSATSIPTVYALNRARRFLDENDAADVTLIATGGFRGSSDIFKALAIGADLVAIGTAALIAIGCHQSRICHTGRCPSGITTHDPELTKNIDIEGAARGLTNFLKATTEELVDFSRLTGHGSLHEISIEELSTTSTEISTHTDIEHA